MRRIKRLWAVGVGFGCLISACAPAGLGVRDVQRVPLVSRGGSGSVGSSEAPASMLDAVSATVARTKVFALGGTVRIPVRWAGGGVIGNNGGSLIGHGGGHLVGNNTASVVSHNGGTALPATWGAEVPLAFAEVSLRDATGAIVKDAAGLPLVTVTDSEGRYGFEALPEGVPLVVTVAVPEQPQPLLAFVPRGSVGVERGVDVISTLVMTYLQARFIIGSQAVFEQLDPKLVEQAQAWLVTALARDGGALPDTLSEAALVALIDRLRAGDPQAQGIYEQVRAQMVVAGSVSAMQGRDRLDWRLNEATALVSLPDGGFYVFERPLHLLWHVSPAGQVRLALAGPQWGYAGQAAGEGMAEYPSGMAVDAAGNVYVADTWNHRVVRYHPDSGVQVVVGDGGTVGERSLESPTGLALTGDGRLLVADTRRGRVVRVLGDGAFEALPVRGFEGLVEPMGLVVEEDGSWLVAEHGRDRVVRVSPAGEGQVLSGALVAKPTGLVRQGVGEYGILSGGSHTVWRYRAGGLTPVSVGGVGQPVSLGADASGLYVGAAGVWRVGEGVERVLGATPERLRAAGVFMRGKSLAVVGDGRVLIEDAGGQAVFVHEAGNTRLFEGVMPRSGGSLAGVPGAVRMGVLPGGGQWVQTGSELRDLGGSRVWLRAEALAPWFAWDRIRSIVFVTETRCLVASANSIVQVEADRITAVAGYHTLLLNGQEPDSGLFDIQDLAWVPAQGLYVLEGTQLKLIPAALLPAW